MFRNVYTNTVHTSQKGQLLVTLNEMSLLSDAKMQVDAVYIDFAKAFDSVSHQKLLLKLESYGFHSHLLAWI